MTSSWSMTLFNAFWVFAEGSIIICQRKILLHVNRFGLHVGVLSSFIAIDLACY